MKRFVIGLALFTMLLMACGTAAFTPTDSDGSDVAAAGDASETSEGNDASGEHADDADGNNHDSDAGDSMESGTTGDGDESAEGSDEAPSESMVVAVPDGPMAPVVTLELDDGSTYTLADAQRPVMFVFWAEW